MSDYVPHQSATQADPATLWEQQEKSRKAYEEWRNTVDPATLQKWEREARERSERRKEFVSNVLRGLVIGTVAELVVLTPLAFGYLWADALGFIEHPEPVQRPCERPQAIYQTVCAGEDVFGTPQDRGPGGGFDASDNSVQEGSLGVGGASEADLMATMQAAQQGRSGTARGIVM